MKALYQIWKNIVSEKNYKKSQFLRSSFNSCELYYKFCILTEKKGLERDFYPFSETVFFKKADRTIFLTNLVVNCVL